MGVLDLLEFLFHLQSYLFKSTGVFIAAGNTKCLASSQAFVTLT